MKKLFFAIPVAFVCVVPLSARPVPDGSSSAVAPVEAAPSVVAASAATGGESTPFTFTVPPDLRNNRYYLESVRLNKLAQEMYDEGDYDASAEYAREALTYAGMSEEYVAKHTMINAEAKLKWAESIHAAVRYPDEYRQAQAYWEEAGGEYTAERWNAAIAAVQQTLNLLSAFEEAPVLPGFYTVREWKSVKDCLWNIAAMPWAYNDPFQWTVIYEANKSVLPRPDKPDLVFPGLVLTLPSVKGEIREGMWVEGVEYPDF
ncbi:MAG: LysM peptidoglycan-binding domain-containing protein [Treponema sp.]|jgi:nucleoid-associated protein YgaU|nr:LysM peptidoglycan-binding domain-containing protein [Treponema sp.]